MCDFYLCSRNCSAYLDLEDYREIFDLVAQSAACSFCTTPLGGSSLTVPCSASSSATHCPARYCNRLCSSRAEKHNHPLLCPARNPSATPLIKFAKDNEWQGLNALIQSTGRILLATQDTGEGPHFEEDWRVFCSFAALGMEERDVWCALYEFSPRFRSYRVTGWALENRFILFGRKLFPFTSKHSGTSQPTAQGPSSGRS